MCMQFGMCVDETIEHIYVPGMTGNAIGREVLYLKLLVRLMGE